MIKIKLIPNDEITLTFLRQINDAKLYEAAYKIKNDCLALKICFPYIESESKKYERFNFIYKNIASAFCSFCQKNCANRSGLYGILKFKFTCFDSKFVSLYMDSVTNIKGEPTQRRVGQIFDFGTMTLVKTKDIIKSKKIKKKEISDALALEYAKKNRLTSEESDMIRKLIKRNLDISKSYMTSNGLRFFFDGEIFGTDSNIIIPFSLNDT